MSKYKIKLRNMNQIMIQSFHIACPQTIIRILKILVSSKSHIEKEKESIMLKKNNANIEF